MRDCLYPLSSFIVLLIIFLYLSSLNMFVVFIAAHATLKVFLLYATFLIVMFNSLGDITFYINSW